MNFKKLIIGLIAIASVAACQKTSYYMTLSEKEYVVEAEGGTVVLELTTNTYVRVNNDAKEWAAITSSEQKGDKWTFTVQVSPYSELTDREGTIRFIGDYVTPLKYTIIQKAVVPVGVDPSVIEVARKETSARFKVLGDKPWTLSCDNSAFVPSITSGTGETTVNVTFPVNETEETAVAHITVQIGSETYTVTINQAGYPKKIYVDLSENGTSNCYVVSKLGYYKFKADVRGNGILPSSCNGEIATAIAPKGAKVLWCTYNTSVAPKAIDEILTGVTLNDGYIQFAVASEDKITDANVIIAAYDNEDCTGNILWSWHIWLCEKTPAAFEIGGAMWMDRNLGATCENIRSDARSCGLFYQWGRKDPLRSASTFTDGDFIATFPEFTEEMVQIMNTDGNGTIQATIANPIPFVQTTKTYKDWVYEADHKDRWKDDQKTMFDPCPAGYKVPSSSQLQAFGEAGGIPSGSQKGDPYKNAYKPDAFVFETSAWTLPLAGILSYDDGSKITDYGKVCRVVTSTYHETTAMTAWYLNCNTSACNFANAATAAHGSAVRCVKE